MQKMGIVAAMKALIPSRVIYANLGLVQLPAEQEQLRHSGIAASTYGTI